jgi:hypothetical protein
MYTVALAPPSQHKTSLVSVQEYETVPYLGDVSSVKAVRLLVGRDIEKRVSLGG